MSITNPGHSDIVIALKGHAKALTLKAEGLTKYAEMLGEMTEEQFMEHLGNQYAGAGFMRQIKEEVFKASEVRPSDTFPIDYSLTEVFAKAQRAAAQS